MSKFFKIFISILIVLLLVSIIGIGIVVYDGYSIYKNAISKISIDDKVKSIQSSENYVQLEDLPQIYLDAVVSVEDHRFYKHSGIDIIATCRAIFINIKNGSLEQGGSTITQQLSKNIYFTQEKKFTRKIAELFVSFDLEKKYSKDDILELYVNTIFFGQGGTGIGEASEKFFNKIPKDLTDYESTFLAGIPNAPSVYSSDNNIDLARERQKQVLDAMVKYGDLSQEQADNIYNSVEETN